MFRMKKILPIILGLLVVGGLSFLLMAFYGNPISKFLALRGFNRHLEENYQDLSYENPRATYSFKEGGYNTRVITDKLDVDFYLEADLAGRISHDSYQEDVFRRGNTYNRLAKEYEDFLDERLKDLAGLEYAVGNFREDEGARSSLELGKTYSIGEMPFEKEISVYIEKEPSRENLLSYLKIIDQSFKPDELDYISIHIRQAGARIDLYEFPRSLVGENLEYEVAKHMENYKDRI